MSPPREERAGLGVVGCGAISPVYLRNLCGAAQLRVVAAADLDPQRARARAAEFGVPKALPVAELLADPDVQIVVNLTPPAAHGPLGLAALQAGKHLYNEKPLAASRAEAIPLLREAAERTLRVGGAPDTFLGPGLQEGRRLLDAGAIGRPTGAVAFMVCHGHESWHPDPAFFYQRGGGPLFDMGPYYLTALVALLGPVRRVAAAARAAFPERTVLSGPRRGERIPVEVPTHVAGLLELEGGVLANLLMSFDVWAANLPRLEIYGTDGTLSLPDPNAFGGPVRLWRAAAQRWEEVPVAEPRPANLRGLGVLDLARALRDGRPARASGELAYHVLDVMESLHESAACGRAVPMASACGRPEPLPKPAK